MKNEHNYYLWYVPREKKYFLENDDCYDGLVISAHIAAHNGKAFTSILNKTGKSYFIDPNTVAFQKNDLESFFNDKGFPRDSWKKLLEHYGPIIKNSIYQGHLITPSDFLNMDGTTKPELNDFITNVFKFQENIIKEKIEELSDFLDIIPELSFYVIPYFYFENFSDPWYELCVKILSIASKYVTDKKVYAVICTNRDVLSSDWKIQRIVHDYNIPGIDGFLIWIDDFDETSESAIYLSNLIKMINMLSKNDNEIINLYGGYFSVLSSYWGMTGHASGVGYRNSKRVYQKKQKGGPSGGPIPRYYIPQFHTRVIIEQGVRLIQQFNELMCGCEVCRNNRRGYDPKIDRRIGRNIMNKHFLTMKKEEVNEVRTKNYAEVFTNLEKTYNAYSRYRTVLPISHLNDWLLAINDNISTLI